MERLGVSIVGPMSPSEVEALAATEAFDAPFKAYQDACWQEATKGLSPEDLAQVEQWWKGGVPKEFWDTVSENAHHIILWLIGRGLG